jgi:hypothetical protein
MEKLRDPLWPMIHSDALLITEVLDTAPNIL